MIVLEALEDAATDGGMRTVGAFGYLTFNVEVAVFPSGKPNSGST